MNCRNYHDHLKAFVDGELRGWLHWRVSRHVHACEACQYECHEIKQLSQRLQAIEMPAVPEGLRERVLQTVDMRHRPEPVRKVQAWRWTYAVPLVLMMSVLYAVYRNTSGPLTEMRELPSAPANTAAKQSFPAESFSGKSALMPDQEKETPKKTIVSEPFLSSESDRVPKIVEIQRDAAPSTLDKAQGAPKRGEKSPAKPGALPRAASNAPVHEVVLQIEVQDLNKALHATMQAAESQNAVLRVSGYEMNRTTASYADVELQIPQGKLNALMIKLHEVGKVTSEKVRYNVEPSARLSFQSEAGIQSEASMLAPPPGMGQADKANSDPSGQESKAAGRGAAVPESQTHPLGVNNQKSSPPSRAKSGFKENQDTPKREDKSPAPLPVVKIRLLLPK